MEEEQPSQMTPEELRNNIEAVLFASGKRVDVYFIKEILGIDNVRKIKNSLEKLKEYYDNNNKVLMITQEGDLWKMNVRENYSNVVRKLISETDLPITVLETLAVIAWKSPVYQSEIVNIRGAGAYEHISLLVETGFVTKDKQGRSYILKVTNKFFEYFDIEGTEGIKEVFKKIKEKPEQKKVEEFNNAEDSENSEDISKEGKEEEPLNPDLEKVGEFDVVNIENTAPEKEEMEEESLGKLKIYEEQNTQEEEKEEIFDDEEFVEPEEEYSNEQTETTQDQEEPVNEATNESDRTKQIVEDLLEEDKDKKE